MKLKLNKKTFKKLNLNDANLPAKMTPRVGGGAGRPFTLLYDGQAGDSAACANVCIIQINPND